MFRSALVAFCVLVVGCSPCRQIATVERDSVVVEIRPRPITIRDTIFVEIPSIVERVELACDSSILSNQYARSEARILSDGSLSHNLESVAQLLEVPTEQVVTLRDSVIYRERLRIERVELKSELSDWQRLQVSGFWILLFIIVLALGLRLK